MLIRYFSGMAFATSGVSIFHIIFSILSSLTDQVISQSVIKDLMMMSPEWLNSDGAEMTLHRTTRGTINAVDWFLSPKGCQPTCRKETAAEVCVEPPTRKELCKLLNNADWCCQEWSYDQPKTPYFKPNCEVVCVAYSPCPYSTCRRCAEINNNHNCCKDRNCTDDNVFTIPDGTKLWNSDSLTAIARAADVSEPADVCPNVPDTVCSNFDRSVVECRNVKGCAYNCASGKCLNSGTIYGKDNCYDSCFNHCADKCGCTGRPGCIWTEAAGGSCKSTANKNCAITKFPAKECLHKDGFYSDGGVLCKSLVQKGDCDLDFTVVAANLGSDKAETASNGIEYQPEADIQKEDPFNISKPIAFTPADIKTDNPRDQEIYATAVTADSSSCQNGSSKCIDYILPTMSWDGDYELALRFVEGVYKDKLKRRFSIKFAGVDIITEFDILSYAEEQYRPLDVYVNFKVSQKAKMITVKGHSPMPLNTTAKLSLCSAECGEDNSFLLSAFHIIKQKEFIPRDPCVEIPQVPRCNISDFGIGDCLRFEGIPTFYALGGKFCQSRLPSAPDNDKNCGNIQVHKAVNFNGLSITDSRGILYEQDKNDQEDANHLKRGRDSFMEAFGYLNAIDRDLYNTLAYADTGKLQGCTEGCIHYDIQLGDDGKYELVVRTADDESDGPGQRKFNVLLGGIAVFPEVDLFQLTGTKSHAVDLTLNFDLTHQGTSIFLEGYSASEKYIIDLPPDKIVKLSFCTSQCENTESRSWLVGAFSLISFNHGQSATNNQNVINDPCASADGDTCNCTSLTHCEYNLQTGKCVERNTVCSFVNEIGEECRRGGDHVFYVQGGQTCPSSGASGNCSVERVMLAVNLGDEATYHKDINGIEYVPASEVKVEDPDNVRTVFPNMSTRMYEGVPQSDVVLYRKYEWGHHRNLPLPQCVSFPVPTAGDGEYEISIKTGEVWHEDSPPIRALSYKLNGKYIVQNFEPAQYAKPPKAMDLNANFRIFQNGKEFSLRGQASATITSADNSIPFEVCHGECSWPGVDINWQLPAFSVVKLKKSVTCATFNGDHCGCRYFGKCQYNVVTKHCRETVNACGSTCNKGNECHRAGDTIFYVRGGLICPNSVAFGNCDVEKTLLAINFYGSEHTDINGITYLPDAGIPYTDPFQIKKNGTAFSQRHFPVEGVPSADVELYNTSMFSTAFKNFNACVTYQVPTDGDGDYELAVKFAELWWPNAKIRVFSYFFNDQPVVESLDMAAVRDAPNKGFDLLVNYKVTNDTLQMQGHPQSNITSADKSIPLSFCPGTCECPPWKDKNFQVAALSVVKFKKVPAPSSI